MLGRYINGKFQSKIPGSARIKAIKDFRRKALSAKKGTIYEIYLLNDDDQPIQQIYHFVC